MNQIQEMKNFQEKYGANFISLAVERATISNEPLLAVCRKLARSWDSQERTERAKNWGN